MKTTYKGPNGIKLQFDSKEIYPNDPGRGTPVLVSLKGETATYLCAVGENEVMGQPLSNSQIEWLTKMEPVVEKFYATNT